MSNITKKIEEIFKLYKDYGNYDYIGENVSQTEHMVLAAMMAENDNCDEESVLAAFFHDIGHLLGHRDKLEQMDEWGTKDHDKLGAEYLRNKGFSEKICKLVNNHVIAKRYLVTVDNNYYNKLSEASKMTLIYQGGKMTQDEIDDFENDPLKDIYIKFRNWEEMAKCSPDLVNSLDKYKNLCYKILHGG